MRPDPLPRSTYRFVHQITTRWADNDVYGHVNNALYYSFFDTTITTYLTAARRFDVVAGDTQIFVAASDCAYFQAFAFPEVIECGLAVADVGRTSVTWRIGLFGAGDNQPRAQGRFVHVCIDRATRRPKPWPQDWLLAFATIQAP